MVSPEIASLDWEALTEKATLRVGKRYPWVEKEEIRSAACLAVVEANHQFKSRGLSRAGWIEYKAPLLIVDELRRCRVIERNVRQGHGTTTKCATDLEYRDVEGRVGSVYDNLEAPPEGLESCVWLLERLTKRQFTCMYFHYELGLKGKEIAALLSCSEQNIHLHLHNGRRVLREYWRDRL